MAIDSGGGGEQENLVVSQQEVVSTANFFSNGQAEKINNSPRKSLQIQNSLHIVKSDVVEVGSHHAQLSLDPVQLALNSVGDMGDLSEMETAQDEAMKLLASHGITMVSQHSPVLTGPRFTQTYFQLPEEPPTLPAHNLTLTEAGKLALSDSSKPPTKISLESKMSSPGGAGSPLPLTKVVKLQSSPVKLSPASSPGGGGSSNKPIRVIKLTPAQAEAFKKSRAAGQVMFSKEKLLSPLSASIVNGGGHLSKENTDQYLNKNILTHSELEPPSKKMMRLDTEKPLRPNKEELQSKLQLELARKAEEADRLREETRQRDLECEKLKQQLQALSS